MEPTHEQLPFGTRLKAYRERSGKTRAVLGGLVGRSAEWVKAIETGRLLPPRLPMMDRLASALRVDVADLAGGSVTQLGETLSGPRHAALPPVRDAINRYPAMAGGPPPVLDDLRDRIAVAWRARHGSPDHRTVLGGLLPDLIRDAQRAVYAYDGAERRQAQVLLADLLGLAQMFIAYQPDASLLWRVVDRAVVAAHESGDLKAIAGATWFAMEAYRDAGEWDTAMAINLDVLELVEPRLANSDHELLALYGALQTGAAFTAARAGEEGRAWRHLDEADRVARGLPPGYAQPWTWFSGPVVGFYAVSLSVELQKGGEALRSARKVPAETITSRPRRARHLIEIARAHNLKAQHVSTVATLRAAYDTAPETIRWNGYARQMTRELLSGPPSVRRDAHDLAARVGLLA